MNRCAFCTLGTKPGRVVCESCQAELHRPIGVRLQDIRGPFPLTEALRCGAGTDE